MAVTGPVNLEDLNWPTARERMHVQLPEEEPHHGRVIQIMPGAKIPIGPDGKPCKTVWSESDGTKPTDVADAHAKFFNDDEYFRQKDDPGAKQVARTVRTTVAPGPRTAALTPKE